KTARKELRGMLATLGTSEEDLEDEKLINSMIDSATYIIEWIEKGGNPEEMRGINVRRAYHIKYLSNMDILPDITEQIPEEREPLILTEEKKRLIVKFFEALSDRERDCFILHATQGMSMSEV